MSSRWRRQKLVMNGWGALVGGSMMIWISLREGFSSVGVVIGAFFILLGLLMLGAFYRMWKRNKEEVGRDLTDPYFSD